MIRQRNNQGRLWLHELIIAGNSRALELALSPSEALAWLHFSWFDAHAVHEVTKDKQGLNLIDTARLLGRFNMEKMVDKFSELHLLFGLSRQLENECEDVCWNNGFSYLATSEGIPNTEALESFGNEKPSSVALRLIQFYRDFGRSPTFHVYATTMERICVQLAEIGHLRALSWLANEDPSLLCYNPTRSTETSEDRHEFAQPELWDLAEVEEKREYMTLTSIAAHGYFISSR